MKKVKLGFEKFSKEAADGIKQDQPLTGFGDIFTRLQKDEFRGILRRGGYASTR